MLHMAQYHTHVHRDSKVTSLKTVDCWTVCSGFQSHNALTVRHSCHNQCSSAGLHHQELNEMSAGIIWNLLTQLFFLLN